MGVESQRVLTSMNDPILPHAILEHLSTPSIDPNSSLSQEAFHLSLVVLVEKDRFDPFNGGLDVRNSKEGSRLTSEVELRSRAVG
jgi:hypothetical protein